MPPKGWKKTAPEPPKRQRRRAISETPAFESIMPVLIDGTRDPDTFDYTDLEAGAKVALAEAKAREVVVNERMQRYGTERDMLRRYVRGLESALGLGQEPTTPFPVNANGPVYTY